MKNNVVKLNPAITKQQPNPEETKVYDFCEAQSDKLFYGQLIPKRNYELKGATDGK